MKFFYRNWGKKTKQTDSDWRTYRTSSKYVKEAIDLYGFESFTFEIVQLFDTRAGVVSGEVELQWAARVLHAVDDKGERMYWNQAIGNIKFISKEHLGESTRAAIGNAHRGKPKPYNIGREPPNKGVPMGEDQKVKLAIAKRGRPANNKNLKASNPIETCAVCGKNARKSDITRYHKHEQT